MTPLAADRAVEGGADLLSEFVIYSVAAVARGSTIAATDEKDKKEADEKAKEVQRIAEAQKNEKAQWDRIARIRSSHHANAGGPSMHTACAVSVCLTLLALIVRVSALALLQIVILRSEERQRQQGGWFGKRVDSPDEIRD